MKKYEVILQDLEIDGATKVVEERRVDLDPPLPEQVIFKGNSYIRHAVNDRRVIFRRSAGCLDFDANPSQDVVGYLYSGG